ncbi:alcohol oxidase [Microstroma glucosiphilum]|uniref:Alcohol oxidase n=1 Tax=Pseudomicrostroma glucosiphilum TaxID=1684307 RepID=A0A316U7K7_9BASI|nr:alcohol oxidase [Pseudomicrostroma glucosiphilum]PWN18935.1 alcohol oxidase [Pseudomicrostroma glucosiphilum]
MATSRDTGVTPQDFESFDFVVVGGGTAGLALAARIAKSSSLSVGVLEAGLWRPEDPKINTPALIGQSLMDADYDWQLMTVPQSESNNREYAWPRGKILGGSSALNFLVWQRGSKHEFDAWAKFGNKGWDWEGLLPYFRHSATVVPPSSQLQKDNFAGLEEDAHGTDGPVSVAFSAWFTKPQQSWASALKEMGLNNNVDGLRGDNSGVWTSPATLDPKTGRRSYSASAHYEPNRGRENLKVLCGAEATQVILENGKAVGVKYMHGGKEYFVNAAKEVVLSGGSINSPALLELSGIGSTEALKSAGVVLKVELPGVGANLQEHLYCSSSYELVEGFETWCNLRQPDFASKAMESYNSQDVDRGILASAFSGFAFLPLQKYMSPQEIEEVRKEVDGHLKSGYYANELEKQSVREVLAQLDNQSIPRMEYIFAPGFFAHASAPKENKNYFSILSALQSPFSRGSIHITSADHSKKPAIDPRYFSVKADLKIMSKAMKNCDAVVESGHLKDLIVRRQDPDPAKYNSEEDFDEFVKDYAQTEYHHIGTCSMAPKSAGGVVDDRLRVYGVDGLRVVDASIMPLMPSSHIVAVVYAIAEKAAAMILEDHQLAAKY